MKTVNSEFIAAIHAKFSTFKKLSTESGESEAWEKMVTGLEAQEQKRIAPFLAKSTLAEGFTNGIPFFTSMGMEMEVVDISNRGSDAALEIQKYCPYLEISKEYGYETPCHIICEMDIEAIRRAFPDMKGEILSRQAAGSSVCLFKYERPAK